MVANVKDGVPGSDPSPLPSEKSKDTGEAEQKEPSSDLSNLSMMDLFRQEAENHCKALSDNLLALERNSTDSEVLASLMRAAHSLKGAARIMNLQCIVDLTHAMEDIFVAAQEKGVEIGAEDIDLLLTGVDKLDELRHIQNDEVKTWLAGEKLEIARLTTDFSRMATKEQEKNHPWIRHIQV